MATSHGAPGTALLRGLKDFYPSGDFSDLTLSCAGREFRVHKVVLCAQSSVFRKMLLGKFKEATTAANVIELEDDPAALEVMLRYFYNFFYDDSARSEASVASFTVRAYAVADKYDIPALRSMAALKFANVCKPTQDLDGFLDAIRAVDENTTDRVLWDLLIPKIRENMGVLLASSRFRELLGEMPTLNYRLLGLLDPSSAGGAWANGWCEPSAGNSNAADEEGDGNYDDEAGYDDSMNAQSYLSSSGRYAGPGRRLG